MAQQGQLFQLKRTGREWRAAVGVPVPGWAAGKPSACSMAGLLRNGTRRRRWNGSWSGCDGSSKSPRSLTLGELVEAYLEQHDVYRVT